MSDPIRISQAELRSPSVDEYVEMQNFLRRDAGPIDNQPWVIRVIYANWFYLSVCSMVGGLVGWAILEPWFDDNSIADENTIDIAGMLLFPVVAACIGLFLGAAEGIICRNPFRAVKSVPSVSGSVSWEGWLRCSAAGFVYAIMCEISLGLMEEPEADVMPTGMALLVLMMGRAAAWGIAAIPAGIGQGIALRERKVILNGVVGAVLGGLVGGLLFDPIYLILTAEDGQAVYSRGVASRRSVCSSVCSSGWSRGGPRPLGC